MIMIRKHRCLLTCLTALLVELSVFHAHASEPLRVLTYNIHHGEGIDERFDLDRIARVILSIDPDVVALQELDHGNARNGADVFQIETLAKLVGMEGRFGKSMDYQGGGYGNGVLVGPRLELIDIHIRSLPNPCQAEPRSFIAATLRFREGEKLQFVMLTTHLDIVHDNAVAQTQVFGELADGFGELPVILAGDFNLRPKDPAIQSLSTAWPDAAANSKLAKLPIDFIRYRPASRWSITSPARFVIDDVTKVASDHFPLVADLKLLSPNDESPKDAR